MERLLSGDFDRECPVLFILFRLPLFGEGEGEDIEEEEEEDDDCSLFLPLDVFVDLTTVISKNFVRSFVCVSKAASIGA